MKLSIKYFIRRNKTEILTAIFALIANILNFCIVSQTGALFFLSVLINLVALFFIVYSKTRETDFYYVSLQDVAQKEDWIGEGTFQYNRGLNAYEITGSEPGFIFSKCLTWSDYKVSFDFKMVHSCIGVIVRAINLSNLAMLQINNDGIRAHIRINGLWSVQEPSVTNLNFTNKLTLDNWYKCQIQCDKRSVRIIIYENDNFIFDRKWEIPTGSVFFGTEPNEGLLANSIVSKIKFPINLEYGTVGFRNADSEKAAMRNFFIERFKGVRIDETPGI